MSRIVVTGPMAEVELEIGKNFGTFDAFCVEHSESDGRLALPGCCDWMKIAGNWEEATRAAAHHADTGD